MSFINLIQALKGGAGSGNWGHSGRIGKVGGSTAGGGYSRLGMGVSHNKYSLEEKRNIAQAFRDYRARVKPAIKQVAEELGYNPKYIQFEGAPYQFNVDGTNYTAGADYNPNTRVIRLFSGVVQEQDKRINITKSVVAHEIQHDKWNSFMETANRQSAELSDRLTQERMDGVDWRSSFMKPDGTFRNATDTAKYKAQDLRSRLLDNVAMKDLQEADGVTGYSASHWANFQRTKKTYDYYRAIDETLAEVSALKVKGNYDKVPKRWQVLHKEISKYAEPI